jgi:hypothetical protein
MNTVHLSFLQEFPGKHDLNDEKNMTTKSHRFTSRWLNLGILRMNSWVKSTRNFSGLISFTLLIGV